MSLIRKFMDACDSNDLKEVRRICSNPGFDVNQTPIYYACWKKRKEIVKILLEHGAKIDSSTQSKYSDFIRKCQNSGVEERLQRKKAKGKKRVKKTTRVEEVMKRVKNEEEEEEWKRRFKKLQLHLVEEKKKREELHKKHREETRKLKTLMVREQEKTQKMLERSLQERKKYERRLKKALEEKSNYIKKVGETRLKLHKIDDTELEFLPDPNHPQQRKRLGEGGLGVVYECDWNLKKRRVAVKEARFVSAPREEVIQEFQAQVALVHPNVLRVYGYAEPSPGIVQIVMEKMDTDLFHFVSDKKPLMPLKIEIMRMMTESLQFLHSQRPHPILHRDIKTMNFLCSNDGKELKICDFGMIKAMANSATYVQSSAKGTSRWMAPEICGIDARYSVYSDIYALAITFWEVLCEKIPYGNANNMQVMMDVCTNGTRPKCDHPRFPTEFKNLLTKLWSQDPKSRGTVEELKHWFDQNENYLKGKYSGRRFPN